MSRYRLSINVIPRSVNFTFITLFIKLSISRKIQKVRNMFIVATIVIKARSTCTRNSSI